MLLIINLLPHRRSIALSIFSILIVISNYAHVYTYPLSVASEPLPLRFLDHLYRTS